MSSVAQIEIEDFVWLWVIIQCYIECFQFLSKFDILPSVCLWVSVCESQFELQQGELKDLADSLFFPINAHSHI